MNSKLIISAEAETRAWRDHGRLGLGDEYFDYLAEVFNRSEQKTGNIPDEEMSRVFNPASA